MKTSPRASSDAGSARRGRHARDRPEVGGDVLAGRPVAAGRALDEPAALVAERDREAVDLELGDVASGPPPAPAPAGRPRPRRTRASKARSSSWLNAFESDSIGRRWRTSSKVPASCAADALRRRVRRDERRKCRLEGDEPAEELVVVGVGEDRRVRLVVGPVCRLDPLARAPRGARPRPRSSSAAASSIRAGSTGRPSSPRAVASIPSSPRPSSIDRIRIDCRHPRSAASAGVPPDGTGDL